MFLHKGFRFPFYTKLHKKKFYLVIKNKAFDNYSGVLFIKIIFFLHCWRYVCILLYITCTYKFCNSEMVINNQARREQRSHSWCQFKKYYKNTTLLIEQSIIHRKTNVICSVKGYPNLT